MKISFGHHGALTVGDPQPEVRARQQDRIWRLDEPIEGNLDAHHKHATVFSIPQGESDPWRHPDLSTELWIVEEYSAKVKLSWQPGTGSDSSPWTEGHDPSGSQLDVLPARAGIVWLRIGGARFPIGFLPRNLLWKTGSINRDDVTATMGRLRAMVRDLLADALGPWEQKSGRASPGLQVTTGDTKTLWWQRLQRLDHLLHEGGVLSAWQALMADPAVLLQSTYPMCPLYRARTPVLSGSRGPWTLAKGWNPHREDGLVRERRVVRTLDTPPNRLAVRLAQRVVEEVFSIKQQRNRRDAERFTGVDELTRQIGDAASMVINAPVFHEVSRDAPLALDSPSLQSNARCRPLLNAWHKIGHGLTLPDDLPLDDAMLRPLEKTHIIYERWCFVLLRRLLAKACGLTGEPGQGEDYVTQEFEVPQERLDGAVTKIVLYHTTCRGTVISGHRGEQDEEEELSMRWSDLVDSWSKVHEPDGLIVLCRGAKTPSVFAWDAKYQRVDPTRSSSSMYQAHAFRDALRWHEGSAPVSWSLVLHAATLAVKAPPPYHCTMNDWSRGIAFEHCAPCDPDSCRRGYPSPQRDREESLLELLQNLIQKGGIPTPGTGSPKDKGNRP